MENNKDYLSSFDTSKGYTSLFAVILLISFPLMLGSLYVILIAVLNTSKVESESFFVALLVAATMILVIGLSGLRRFFIQKGLKLTIFLKPSTKIDSSYNVFKQISDNIFRFKYMTIVGFIYAFSISSGVFIINPWSNQTIFRLILSLFLFSVNFPTGIAFYSLLAFFVQSNKLGKLVNINLWQVENPLIHFFFGIARRISLLVSIYSCISVCSILLSPKFRSFLFNESARWSEYARIPVIAYCVFIFVMVILAIVIPPLPVVQKLREAKAEALVGLNKRLHLAFYSNLGDTATTNENIDFEKVKTLLELREKVENINIWPFRVKSVLTGLTVLFFSSVPIILQEVVKHALNT